MDIRKEKHFNLYLAVIIILFLISVVSVSVLHKQKKKQPLRKISPNLMIVSVVGNFLCMVNICLCLIFFELFTVRQSGCLSGYSGDPNMQRLCI